MRLNALIAPPGLFRIALAYIVFVNHSLPIHLGSLAVYLFFMLSGYWVFHMWGREYAPTEAPYRNFIVSRFWRLMPVYYVALALFLLIDFVFPSGRIGFQPDGLWSTFHFYLSQLLILGYAPLPYAAKTMPPVWSLDIELQFYLAAPLVIWLLSNCRAGSLPRLALWFVALAGFAAFVVFFGNIHAQSAFLPMYLVFFLIGSCSARYSWKPNPSLAVGGLAAALLLIAACIVLPATRPLLIEGSFSGWLSGFNPDANIVLALLVAPYAMSTVSRSPRKGSRLARLDRDLSNVTYEIYLLHPAALLIVAHFVGDVSKYRQLPVIVLAWLGLFPVAWLIYRTIDQPIDRLRTAYIRSRRRTGEPSVPADDGEVSPLTASA
jgi:peptidoglycan/LPS O-acetylase OafA/YrhL